jgi:hypothetical protein
MFAHNLRLIAILWLCVPTTLLSTERTVPALDEPTTPSVGQSERRFLSRVARRALDQYVSDGTARAAGFAPTSLADLKCHVVVTLRAERRQIGSGSSGPKDVTAATIEATLAAAQIAARSGTLDSKSAGSTLIEIEVIGSAVPVSLENLGSKPGLIDRVLEPGVDGIQVTIGQVVRRVCPSELAAKNQVASVVLKSIVESTGRSPNAARLSRFRTVHWYEPAPDADIVSLRRGLVLVAQEAVTEREVGAAIDRIGARLLYRQQPTGSFAYEYEPAGNSYNDRDDPVHQAGAAWAMGLLASRSPASAYKAGADLAVGRLLRQVVDLRGVDGAAFVASSRERNPAAVSAYLCRALSGRPASDVARPTRDRLVNSLLWLQKPSGEFITAYPPTRRLPRGFTTAGVTLLAFLDIYREKPDRRILDAFNKAFAHYESVADARPSLESAAWLARPFAQMSVESHRKEFARFAFRLADRLVAWQRTADNCRWPELYGSIVTEHDRVPSIGTAVALEALVDAWLAARAFGDVEREARYAEASRRAVRFVLQLEVRAEETYATRIVDDVLGAVRTSIADNRLRIDNLQHALASLMRFSDVAYPDR